MYKFAIVKGSNCYKSAVESTVTHSTSSKCLLVNVLAETKRDDNGLLAMSTNLPMLHRFNAQPVGSTFEILM